jgi:hypothetical protein
MYDTVLGVEELKKRINKRSVGKGEKLTKGKAEVELIESSALCQVCVPAFTAPKNAAKH